MTSEAMVVDVSQDWLVACDVQQRFMQALDRPADSLDYAGRCRQLQALGGDCFEFAPLADGRLAMTIGDASGKGLAAALMISNVQSSLRTAAFFTGDDLASAMTAVSRQVYAASLENRYATLFYGVFDSASRVLRYVNAGHNPPIILRRDGTFACLESGGAPVGLFPNSRYEEHAIQLCPGDRLIAYTDGVTEAVNGAGEEWGIEGLRRAVLDAIATGAEEIVEAIFASMEKCSQGRQSDDATLAILRVN